MVDQETLKRLVEQLRAEHEAVRAEYMKAQRRMSALRQAVESIEKLLETFVLVDATEEASTVEAALAELGTSSDQLNVVVDPDRPRGAEAVRRVLVEEHGKAWTPRELAAELDRRGWAPESKSPVDAVRTALMRAWRAPDSGITREGSKFIYRPSPNGGGPSEDQGVSSDQEMKAPVLTFTGGSQQADKPSEQS